MSALLEEGQKLQRINFNDGGCLRVGFDSIESITVSMENGQMAGVPWAKIEGGEEPIGLINLAHVEGVVFEDE